MLVLASNGAYAQYPGTNYYPNYQQYYYPYQYQAPYPYYPQYQYNPPQPQGYAAPVQPAQMQPAQMPYVPMQNGNAYTVPIPDEPAYVTPPLKAAKPNIQPQPAVQRPLPPREMPAVQTVAPPTATVHTAPPVKLASEIPSTSVAPARPKAAAKKAVIDKLPEPKVEPVGPESRPSPAYEARPGEPVPSLGEGDSPVLDLPSGCAGVLSGGFGVYYLKPHFDTNPAFARSTNVMTPTTATTVTSQENFDWDAHWAPLVWLEYAYGDLPGIRGRFWRFDDHPASRSVANPFNPGGNPLQVTNVQVTSAFPLGLGIISNPGGAGAGFNDQLQFQSGLTLDVVDLEATKRFQPGCVSLGVSGGIRYARAAQNYDAFLLSTPAVPGASTVQSTLRSGHDLRGAGGTIAFEASYAFGGSGLSVFCNGRGSLLFGRGQESASLLTVTTDPAGLITTQSLSASTNSDRLLPITEIELGVDYTRRIGRIWVCFQTALVDQVWFGAGNAANNETITGSGTVLTVPVTQAADNHTSLGLFGLRTSLGFRY